MHTLCIIYILDVYIQAYTQVDFHVVLGVANVHVVAVLLWKDTYTCLDGRPQWYLLVSTRTQVTMCWILWSCILLFLTVKIINFRGDLTNVSASSETLVSTPAGDKKKGTAGVKGARKEVAVSKSNWPVTDWRCFDQRNQGYYTWLEPPNQDTDILCAGCDCPLIRVHRHAPRCLWMHFQNWIVWLLDTGLPR